MNCFYRDQEVNLTAPIEKEDEFNYGRYWIVAAILIMFLIAILAIAIVFSRKKRLNK